MAVPCSWHQGSKQGLTPEIFLSNTTGKATCAIKELVVLSTFSFSFLTSNAIIFSGKFWCICRIGGHTQPRWQLGWFTSKQQHWHAAGFGMLSQHTRDLELANAWSPRRKDSESLKTSPWLWKPGFRRSTLRMISHDNYAIAIKGSLNRQKLEVDPLCSSLIR